MNKDTISMQKQAVLAVDVLSKSRVHSFKLLPRHSPGTLEQNGPRRDQSRIQLRPNSTGIPLRRSGRCNRLGQFPRDFLRIVCILYCLFLSRIENGPFGR